MTQIEIYCLGRRLKTDDGREEYSHQSEPVPQVDVFEGEGGSGHGWTSVRRKQRPNHFVRLLGDEYGVKSGEMGLAEAARRFGTPTSEQERLLSLPPHQNYNLECKTCGFKLTRHDDVIQQALDNIATLARDSPDMARQAGIIVNNDDVLGVALRTLAGILR